MNANDMVLSKRTWDMEQLLLMLQNDSKAYSLWHDKAEAYARKIANGEAVLMDNLALVMVRNITQSCDRLMDWHRKVICEPLTVTQEQKEIVAWQWFYNDLMDTYEFIKNN